MKVDDPGSTRLVLRFFLMPPHLDVASVNKGTPHRIVQPLLELNLVERHSEGLVGATFVLEEVMFHEPVVAESSALAVGEGIMWLSALASLDQDLRNQDLVLVLRPHLLSTLKHHLTIRRLAVPCVPTLTSVCFCRQHRLLRSILTAPRREEGFGS